MVCLSFLRGESATWWVASEVFLILFIGLVGCGKQTGNSITPVQLQSWIAELPELDGVRVVTVSKGLTGIDVKVDYANESQLERVARLIRERLGRACRVTKRRELAWGRILGALRPLRSEDPLQTFWAERAYFGVHTNGITLILEGRRIAYPIREQSENNQHNDNEKTRSPRLPELVSKELSMDRNGAVIKPKWDLKWDLTSSQSLAVLKTIQKIISDDKRLDGVRVKMTPEYFNWNEAGQLEISFDYANPEQIKPAEEIIRKVVGQTLRQVTLRQVPFEMRVKQGGMLEIDTVLKQLRPLTNSYFSLWATRLFYVADEDDVVPRIEGRVITYDISQNVDGVTRALVDEIKRWESEKKAITELGIGPEGKFEIVLLKGNDLFREIQSKISRESLLEGVRVNVSPEYLRWDESGAIVIKFDYADAKQQDPARQLIAAIIRENLSKLFENQVPVTVNAGAHLPIGELVLELRRLRNEFDRDSDSDTDLARFSFWPERLYFEPEDILVAKPILEGRIIAFADASRDELSEGIERQIKQLMAQNERMAGLVNQVFGGFDRVQVGVKEGKNSIRKESLTKLCMNIQSGLLTRCDSQLVCVYASKKYIHWDESGRLVIKFDYSSPQDSTENVKEIQDSIQDLVKESLRGEGVACEVYIIPGDRLDPEALLSELRPLTTDKYCYWAERFCYIPGGELGAKPVLKGRLITYESFEKIEKEFRDELVQHVRKLREQREKIEKLVSLGLEPEDQVLCSVISAPQVVTRVQDRISDDARLDGVRVLVGNEYLKWDKHGGLVVSFDFGREDQVELGRDLVIKCVKEFLQHPAFGVSSKPKGRVDVDLLLENLRGWTTEEMSFWAERFYYKPGGALGAVPELQGRLVTYKGRDEKAAAHAVVERVKSLLSKDERLRSIGSPELEPEGVVFACMESGESIVKRIQERVSRQIELDGVRLVVGEKYLAWDQPGNLVVGFDYARDDQIELVERVVRDALSPWPYPVKPRTQTLRPLEPVLKRFRPLNMPHFALWAERVYFVPGGILGSEPALEAHVLTYGNEPSNKQAISDEVAKLVRTMIGEDKSLGVLGEPLLEARNIYVATLAQSRRLASRIHEETHIDERLDGVRVLYGKQDIYWDNQGSLVINFDYANGEQIHVGTRLIEQVLPAEIGNIPFKVTARRQLPIEAAKNWLLTEVTNKGATEFFLTRSYYNPNLQLVIEGVVAYEDELALKESLDEFPVRYPVLFEGSSIEDAIVRAKSMRSWLRAVVAEVKELDGLNIESTRLAKDGTYHLSILASDEGDVAFLKEHLIPRARAIKELEPLIQYGISVDVQAIEPLEALLQDAQELIIFYPQFDNCVLTRLYYADGKLQLGGMVGNEKDSELLREFFSRYFEVRYRDNEHIKSALRSSSGSWLGTSGLEVIGAPLQGLSRQGGYGVLSVVLPYVRNGRFKQAHCCLLQALQLERDNQCLWALMVLAQLGLGNHQLAELGMQRLELTSSASDWNQIYRCLESIQGPLRIKFEQLRIRCLANCARKN